MESFVPDAEQRLWRTLTRTRYQLTCDRVRLQNQLEALLEDAQIKLSSCVSDLLGLSSRKIMEGLAQGETDPGKLATLAAPGLHASAAQLCDALQAAAAMSGRHRQILRLSLGPVSFDRTTTRNSPSKH